MLNEKPMNQEHHARPSKRLPSSAATLDRLVRIGTTLVILAIVVTLALIIRGLIVNVDQSPRTAIENNLLLYSERVREDPEDGEAYMNLGITYSDMGRYDKAVENFELAVTHFEQTHEAYYGLGQVREQMGDFDKAIDAYKLALKENSRFGAAHFRIGTIYNKQSKRSDAVNHLEKSLQIDPTNADAYYQLGQTYLALDQKLKAEKAFRGALALVPDYAAAKKALRELKTGEKK